jgi:metallo-beta-lactamase family protein
MAKLTFHGAIEGVTGSCYLLETKQSRILLDCGMFQGGRKEEANNTQDFAFKVKDIDTVVLSHAHLDHSGRLPKLVQDGYEGLIYMTDPTANLLEVLLKDAANLQKRDVEWENKRRRRAGKDELEPIYTLEDVEQALTQCEGITYSHRIPITADIDICFLDAGHILGSSIVQVFINENGQEKKLVFSGDLGNSYAALLQDPTVVKEADILLLESTYGDRNHRSMDETLEEFEAIIDESTESGGNILIPSFAVGRTQEILFRLGELYQKGKLRHHEIYLDSPMAIAVTEIYHRYQNIFNKEDKKVMAKGCDKSLHNFLPNLHFSISTEESIELNKVEKGNIIIAGSGMCNGGRIRHHLKHNLWRDNAHLLIVGYQAIGTPGRALVDGASVFKVAGEEVVVRAKIHTLGGFSAHASQSQLLDWINNFDKHPKLYLVHGEAETKQKFKRFLAEKGWASEIPELNESIHF